jgi:septum formation protein
VATVVLASASPRRVQLLRSIGIHPVVRPVDLDESVRADEAPRDYVERLAIAKATADVRPGEIVIGADTTVVLDEAIIAKPLDADDARRMLRALSGRTHTVFTGVAVITAGAAGSAGPTGRASGARMASAVERTDVTFAPLTAAVIDRYVATGEPLDKAGAYGMQDGAGLFVTRIDGSPSNVIGLPLHVLPALGVPLDGQLDWA